MRRKIPLLFTYSGKLILIFIALLCISSLIIGITAYRISHNELNKKGEHILKNSVLMALNLIESEYNKVQSGIIELEESQEYIKETLLGPMDKDSGRRILHKNIDLGEHGYFIIYDSSGLEVMHPSLEGINVLNVTDLKDSERYLVKEQIDVGKNGGGFIYYSWVLPDSEEIGRKISYCGYFHEWDWIVVSTAYELDFNRAADIILIILLSLITCLILIASIIIVRYVRKATKPIVKVVEGMNALTDDRYEYVDKVKYRDEITFLVNGYNEMISSLQKTRNKLKKKNDFINYIAYYDDLTGLLNRHGIEGLVSAKLEQGCSSGYLAQMDIVGLKIINSTLGYIQGDLLLKQIGGYFQEVIDDKLIISRTSSNEFTLCIVAECLDEAVSKLYNLRDSVINHVKHQGFGKLIGLQMAIVSYPENGSSFPELYEKVSMAMKSAKDTQSMNLVVYNDDISSLLQSEISMKEHLFKALNKNEIVPYYQAQVDYNDGSIVGLEALSRWHSKELGFVSPGAFIPIIESQNMVVEFTHYMIERVLKDYKDLKNKYNSNIKISINISPAYFINPDCYEYLLEIINKYKIPNGKLILEITEDVFISEPEKINKIIEDLHSIGVLISIDDFGTGYSSLNYLTEMNFDEMKIDKSFIDKIIDEPKSLELFKVLCDIAAIYDYDIVAEGVETEEQLQKIKDTSLRIIQGYLFSKPEPL